MEDPSDHLPTESSEAPGAIASEQPPASKSNKEQKSLSERLKEAPKVLASIPRVFGLVWNSNPQLAFTIMITEVVLGLVPLANVWVFKILFDSVPTLIAAAQKSGTPSSVSIFSIEQLQLLPNSITTALALIAFCWFAKEALEPISDYCREQLNDCLTRDINLLIMSKTSETIDITILESPKFYDHLQRILNELTFKPIHMLSVVSQIGRALITLVSLAFVLFALSPFLVLFIFLLSAPRTIFNLRKMYDEWDVILGDVPEVRRMRYYASVLTNNQDAKEIRLFGLGSYFKTEFLNVFKGFQQRRTAVRRKHLGVSVLLAMMSAIGTVVSYVYAVLCSIAGKVSAGSLAMYLGTISQMDQSIAVVMFYLTELYRHTQFVISLFEFLEIPPAIPPAAADSLVPLPIPLQKGIEFRNVSFKYPGTERLILDRVSFCIEPGKAIALVGENGAGKTTIVKLLSRLYDPTAGEILIDGIDLRRIDPEVWRSQLAVVFQDYCRFHMSVRENIGIGNVPLIDNVEAVKIAAQKGGAAAMISRLQNTYSTMLGKMFENESVGTELSGGEWQKIALARAFMRTTNEQVKEAAKDAEGVASSNIAKTNNMKQAQLLILDEPTASLDVQSEYDVYCRFHELTADKMALLITHRFSTVRIADRILVLEHGKIIEEGSHNELINIDSSYAKLYNLQADRYR